MCWTKLGDGRHGDTSVWDPSLNSLPVFSDNLQINNDVDVSISPIDLKELHRTIAT